MECSHLTDVSSKLLTFLCIVEMINHSGEQILFLPKKNRIHACDFRFLFKVEILKFSIITLRYHARSKSFRIGQATGFERCHVFLVLCSLQNDLDRNSIEKCYSNRFILITCSTIIRLISLANLYNMYHITYLV